MTVLPWPHNRECALNGQKNPQAKNLQQIWKAVEIEAYHQSLNLASVPLTWL